LNGFSVDSAEKAESVLLADGAMEKKVVPAAKATSGTVLSFPAGPRKPKRL